MLHFWSQTSSFRQRFVAVFNASAVRSRLHFELQTAGLPFATQIHCRRFGKPAQHNSTIVIQQNICWLDIPVHNIRRVDISQRTEKIIQNSGEMHLAEIILALTQQHFKIVRHIFRDNIRTLLSKYNVIDLRCEHVVFHFRKLLYDLYFSLVLDIVTGVDVQAFDGDLNLLGVMNCSENPVRDARQVLVLLGQLLGQS